MMLGPDEAREALRIGDFLKARNWGASKNLRLLPGDSEMEKTHRQIQALPIRKKIFASCSGVEKNGE